MIRANERRTQIYKDMKNLRKNLQDQRGFNLIELMIVIAVIGLLIGIGGYAWSTVIVSGNETSATKSIETIKTLQAQYASAHRGKFAATFDELVDSVSLDPQFRGENPIVNGYLFTLNTTESPAFYSVNADPEVAEGVAKTGNRHFYFDSTLGTSKSTDENRPATADDPSI